MRVEWDEAKNRHNITKHRISFETAQFAFDDPHALSRFDCFVDEEERWHTLGLISGVMVVLVVHTYREDQDEIEVIRIISARKATAAERKQYEKSRKA